MQQHNPGSLVQFEATEDATGSAGWMFSDMLVALMVVFLATITFIPQFAGSSSAVSNSGSSEQVSSGNYNYTEHFPQAMIRAYSMDQVKTVAADVATFLKNNNLPASAIIDSAQFVGGYTSTETAADAIARAMEFSTKLNKDYPKLLEHSSTILNTSPKLNPSLVTLRFTFSALVNTDK